MNKLMIDALCCPFCSGHLTVIKGDEQSGTWGYAILGCFCDVYPVVSGIPIIRKGVVGNRGETNRTISRLVELEKHREALIAMTMPAGRSTEAFAPGLLQRRMGGLGSLQGMRGGRIAW